MLPYMWFCKMVYFFRLSKSINHRLLMDFLLFNYTFLFNLAVFASLCFRTYLAIQLATVYVFANIFAASCPLCTMQHCGGFLQCFYRDDKGHPAH